MARWDPNASGRLVDAALELFAQHGFDDTTVPQIAARAGVTTRTFFRHFADKREVLFGGEQELATVIADLITDAPSELSAVAAVEHALLAAAESEFEPRRAELRRWREVVDADDALQERGSHKQRQLISTATRALHARGIDIPTAELAAGMSFVAFQTAAAQWHHDDEAVHPLTTYVEDTFARLRDVVSADGPAWWKTAETGPGAVT